MVWSYFVSVWVCGVSFFSTETFPQPLTRRLWWEKVGILSWLMGKGKENYINIMVLPCRSEKSNAKMEDSGCFTGYFEDTFVCVCVYVYLYIRYGTTYWLNIDAVLCKENIFLLSSCPSCLKYSFLSFVLLLCRSFHVLFAVYVKPIGCYVILLSCTML